MTKSARRRPDASAADNAELAEIDAERRALTSRRRLVTNRIYQREVAR